MTSIIITGCDRGYFHLALQLVRSLRQGDRLAGQQIGFIDFGLDASQRDWLAEQGVEIKPGGWDLDFPSRSVWEANKPWFKVYVCRPHLRRYFPDYDVYAWLDADTWAQEPAAVEQLIAAAGRGGLAASPEIDRSYYKFNERYATWEFEHDVARYCLGAEIGERLRWTPSFNAGVFAMRRDAPQWELWRGYLEQGLSRVDPLDENARMVEQVAFNAAIYLHDAPVHRFPSTYNWLACFARPLWDFASRKFVEPAPPYQPIGIMHLSVHYLEQAVTIGGLYDGSQCITLTIPLTLEGKEGLERNHERLVEVAQVARAQAQDATFF